MVVDLVAPTARASPNGKWIERLRDPSRVQMPPRGVVSQWLQEYGLEVGGVADWRSSGPVLPWLEQAVIDASAAALVCEAFETELVGGELTGMCPHRSVGARGVSLVEAAAMNP